MSREKLVRDTAYAIWEAEGRPEGRDSEHWQLAEERVAQGDAQQGQSKSKSSRGRTKTDTAAAPAATKSRSKKAS